MNFFDNLVDIKIKKDMGILGGTDEFFCVYLNSLFKSFKILFNFLCEILYIFPWILLKHIFFIVKLKILNNTSIDLINIKSNSLLSYLKLN